MVLSLTFIVDMCTASYSLELDFDVFIFLLPLFFCNINDEFVSEKAWIPKTVWFNYENTH